MTPSPADPAAALLQERAARFAAEAALFLRDHVLSVASHDLRSPLNAMHSWAYVLERQLAHADANLQRALAGIRAGIGEQTNLLDTVLDAPRAATRTLAVERGDVALDGLLTDSVALARVALADARGTSIAIANRASAGTVLCIDRDRVAQALWTMLVLAVEASAPHGAVTLDAEFEAHGARLIVSFTAHAAALTDPALPHVFDAFARREAQREREANRHAWVLALCQRVAHAHGGTFMQQALTERTQLVLALPLADRP